MIRRFRYIDGDVREVTDEPAAVSDTPMLADAYREDKPWKSTSLGCHPDQVPELRERVRQEGLSGVQVHKDGSVSTTSRSARRGLMRIFQTHDHDAGYGDLT